MMVTKTLRKDFAGFRAYSKSPKLKRSYLQVQLTQELEKDQTTCRLTSALPT